jgi:hypothetical protein
MALKVKIVCVGHGPVMMAALTDLFLPQRQFAFVPIVRDR